MCGLRYQYLISREGGGKGGERHWNLMRTPPPPPSPGNGELVGYVRRKIPVPYKSEGGEEGRGKALDREGKALVPYSIRTAPSLGCTRNRVGIGVPVPCGRHRAPGLAVVSRGGRAGARARGTSTMYGVMRYCWRYLPLSMGS